MPFPFPKNCATNKINLKSFLTHRLLIVGHDDAAEGGELGVHLRVVDGPEAVEEEVGLVPLGGVLHVEVRLVAHHVVHKVEPVGGRVGERRSL